MQITAFAAYQEGCHRGSGPTIFNLAYKNGDAMGSLDAFKKALNLLLSDHPKYDFYRSMQLHGDIRTSSMKRKGKALATIEDHDSHRHEKFMHTTSPSSAVKRRNLYPDFRQSWKWLNLGSYNNI